MFYVIIGEDRAGTLDQRMAARPDHVARLQALQAQGKLLLAGPCPAIDSPDPGPAGFIGSIIIAEFASLDAARTWADADPYVAAGVYEKVTVKPFKKVLPA
ncbi:MAG: YciI family protein [Betaproteobacteria bacterium]|uniref:YciI family protein n=1 Tax=Candidatus Proximibacter danicus TaxID=2954365 RepID=A0A9D7JY73_9PROT|nr:YciI family protein [Candidatus Proximibacter danicus]